MGNEVVISYQNEVFLVNSREVAENFGKRHGDVIEKIEELIKTENSVLTMFNESDYQAGTRKNY